MTHLRSGTRVDHVDRVEQFKAALRARDIVPPSDLIADGRLHRCDAAGRHGKGDASYVLHLDGVPRGGYQNWRVGIGWQDWRAGTETPLSPAQDAELRRQIEATRAEREVDAQRRGAEAAERAARIWADALDCAGHAYLTRKAVRPHGVRLRSGRLVVPLRDVDGILHSLQFIADNGQKRYLTGGRIRGCYFAMGDPNDVIIVAEGLATGASIHEATGFAVIAAMDSGNLQPVAEAIRGRFPSTKMIIAADDDHQRVGNLSTPERRCIGGPE